MSNKKTNRPYTVDFRHYGEITVPEGTTISNETALGHDEKYNFVLDLTWIDRDYPTIANLLKHDAFYYGINVPKEYVSEVN